MSEVNEAIENWKQTLLEVQEKYLADAAAALAVHCDPAKPESQAVGDSYSRMLRVMLGEGLKLPKGFSILDKDRLPYVEESD